MVASSLSFMNALQSRLGALVLVLCLTAGPAWAQTPPAQPPAATPPAAHAAPPKPFPEGAKIAYIDVNRVVVASAEGKAASGKLEAFKKKKSAEILEKNKSLEEMNKKLQQGGTVLNDQARAQLQADIGRLQREIQFLQQDAQAELQRMDQELQAEFQRKLNPVLNQVSEEKGLYMLFNIREAGALWWHPGLDLTDEIVKRLDAASKSTANK